jgi:hypothetical protein
LTLEGYGKLES